MPSNISGWAGQGYNRKAMCNVMRIWTRWYFMRVSHTGAAYVPTIVTSWTQMVNFWEITVSHVLLIICWYMYRVL